MGQNHFWVFLTSPLHWSKWKVNGLTVVEGQPLFPFTFPRVCAIYFFSLIFPAP